MTFDEVQAIADEIRYKDWMLQTTGSGYGSTSGDIYIHWVWSAPCVNGGNVSIQHSREWVVTACDEEAIVKTAFAAAKMAEEHECAENFNYKGRRIFDPHRKLL